MAEENWGFDGEHYCTDCLPVDVDNEGVFNASGEQDLPAHCSVCGKPLDYSLTYDGVAYVLEHLVDAIRAGLDWRIEDIATAGGRSWYYNGVPHCTIIADQAKEIEWYGGLGKHEAIVRRFLELFKAGPPAGKTK